MEDNSNGLQEGIDSVNQVESNIDSPIEPPKKSNKKLITLIVVLLVIVGIVIVVYFLNLNNKDSTTENNSTTNQSQLKTEDVKVPTPIPRALYEQSKNISGVSVGYVKSDSETSEKSSFNLIPKATAQEDSYKTAIFYSSGGEVYAFYTNSKENVKISSGTSAQFAEPVFSSVSQNVAYSNGNTMVIKNVQTEEEILVKESDNELSRVRGLTWSPDGDKIFVWIDSGANPGTEEYAKSEFGFYSIKSNKITKITIPEPYNNMANPNNVQWIDAENVLVEFAEKTPFGEFNGKSWFEVNVVDDSSKLSDTFFEDLAGVHYANEEVYFLEEGSIKKSNINDLNSKSTIPSTEGANLYYLLKQDAINETATDVIYNVGQAGEEAGITYKSLSLENNEVKDLTTPEGFSTYIIGWNQDYSEFYYQVNLSATIELRAYNLLDNTESVLIDNLPW